MSYQIEGTTISMTRGDTLKVAVSLTKDGQPYTPVEGDKIRFAAKDPKMYCDKGEYVDSEPRILKDIPIETMMLVLDPADTKTLDFGNYVYDMEITFADGTVDTFITQAVLRIKPEVH